MKNDFNRLLALGAIPVLMFIAGCTNPAGGQPPPPPDPNAINNSPLKTLTGHKHDPYIEVLVRTFGLTNADRAAIDLNDIFKGINDTAINRLSSANINEFGIVAGLDTSNRHAFTGFTNGKNADEGHIAFFSHPTETLTSGGLQSVINVARTDVETDNVPFLPDNWINGIPPQANTNQAMFAGMIPQSTR